jgi:RNA 3'-terminal phosphate cyclase (ATP)
MIHVDGSYGEGGGQIIRTAVSLAVITGEPIEIANIRAKRKKPGLQPQHLAAVKAAAELCGAKMRGDAVGSVHLEFKPAGPVKPGEYAFDIGTAGSAPLVAQTVIMPLVLAGGASKVSVTGGTHNPMAPTSDYLERVYGNALRRMGIDIEVRSPRAGFYPAGGGLVEVEIKGGQLRPIKMTARAPIRDLEAIVTTSKLRPDVAERAEKVIRHQLGNEPALRVRIEDKPSTGPGAAVVIVAEHEHGVAGATVLGSRGKLMEVVTGEACKLYIEWRDGNAAIDEHLADQLVLPACFDNGESAWTTPVVTEHLRTVVWLVQKFFPITFDLGETVRISRT